MDIFDSMIGNHHEIAPDPCASATTMAVHLPPTLSQQQQRHFPVLKIVEPGDAADPVSPLNGI